MKIAASDFDGTISFFEKGIPRENLDAIHKWQEAGHKFGLVTGRNLGLAKHGLSGYDLKPDFFVCLNGASAFDGNENLLYEALITPDILKKLLDTSAARLSRRIGFLQSIDSYGYVRRISPEDYFFKNLPIQSINESEMLNVHRVAQISLVADSPESAIDVVNDIHEKFPNQLCAAANGKYIDINPSGIDKGTGLFRLLKCMEWQDAEVFTIGDNLNDIPMLQKFQGFTIESATDAAKAAARKIYPFMADMLKEHL